VVARRRVKTNIFEIILEILGENYLNLNLNKLFFDYVAGTQDRYLGRVGIVVKIIVIIPKNLEINNLYSKKNSQIPSIGLCKVQTYCHIF
jgi:hypothetical protein